MIPHRTCVLPLKILLALLLLSAPLLALPEGITERHSLAGISEYQLDNGLKILLFPDSSTAKTTVNVTYLVGSRHEGYGESGMAHLLEHLLFKGSQNHPDIPQELSEHGASANGTTWLDRTNYYETFPSTDKNLSWALSMEADRMINSFISKEDLESEMTVVRNEYEQGEDNPSRVLNKRIFSTAYIWHNYGNPTIGARSDIERVPIEKLQAFYRTYYQPDNAILIVAGRFQPEFALQEILRTFGQIPKPQRELPKTYTTEPTQDGERRVELKRVGENPLIAAAYHIPAGSHPDFAALDILGQILGDSPSGRLYKALVRSRLATSVGGGSYQLHDPGLLYLQAAARQGADLEKIESTLLATAQGFVEEPPTDEEVERARQSLLKSMESTKRDSRTLALQLSEWAAMGDWRLFFLHNQRLAQVTPEDVSRVAQAYLITSNRTVGVFLPTEDPLRAEIPEQDHDGVLQALSEMEIPEELVQGEEFDPSPRNIAERTSHARITEGLQVAFHPRATRGSTVHLDLNLHFGNPDVLQNLGAVPDFTGYLLDHGTVKRTREQLKDLFTQLEADGSVGGDYNGAYASMTTTRENLPELLRAVAEILQEPSFPEEEFETVKEAYLASIERAKSDPSSRAGREMSRILSPYLASDPRYVATLDEEWSAVNEVRLEQLPEFHRSFYGAQVGEIAIVGDFDPDEIGALLGELFSDWQPSGPPVPYRRFVAQVKAIEEPVRQTVRLEDKTNAVFYARKTFEMLDTHPDYAAVRLANYLLGGGFLNSRLATRVRQDEGLSYSIRSSASASSRDPVASFSIYAIAAPENIEAVEAAVFEELDKAMSSGFEQSEIEAAKRGYLESLKVARSQDANLAGLLTSYMELERDVLWLEEWEEKILAVTDEDLQRVVGEYFHPTTLNVVKAGTLPTP